MVFELKNYRNGSELANLNGYPIYTADMIDAALRGRLNVFLQGDTGSGKTQLMRDVMRYFGDKSLFILGRNDMDTRELFQQINPEFLKAIREGNGVGIRLKELSEKVNYNFIGVDELPNCLPVVRAQLFNLFDGFIEIDGKAYPIGSGYSVGMATGNIGQQFTESSNELGRALKDRMHVIIDTDYFRPRPRDIHDILTGNLNPRVNFTETLEDRTQDLIESHQKLEQREVPFEKFLVAGYLIHGLDYLDDGRSKIEMKSGWPNKVENHEAGSDAALVLPVSPRAAKSIITLSQALDQITEEKGATELDYFNSMMTAYKFVSAYSGVLNEAMVRELYGESRYKAIDAVIASTTQQFADKGRALAAAVGMVKKGALNEKVLGAFDGRWLFARDIFENMVEKGAK